MEAIQNLNDETVIRIKDEEARLTDTMWNEAKALVEREKKRLSDELEQAKDSNEALLEQSLKSIHEIFDDNQSKWRKELFDRCINVSQGDQ